MTAPAGAGAPAAGRTGSSRRRKVALAVLPITALALAFTGAVLLRGPVGGNDEDGALRPYPTQAVPDPDTSPPRPGSVRPEDFGAVGDGIHDDGPALQAALEAADGRAVELAGGATYLSRHALRIPSHTTLRGPRTATLKFTWTTATETGTGGPFYLGNADPLRGNVDIVLQGFSIRGAGDGLPAGPSVDEEPWNLPAIRLRLVNSFTLLDLDIGYAPGISVLYQGSVHGMIARNHVHHSGRDGITGTWFEENLADITVSDNLIEQVGDDGIAVAGTTHRMTNSEILPTDIEITGNRISGWAEDPNGLVLGRGIALLSVTHVVVSDNHVARTAGAGILLRGAASRDSVNPLDGKPWVSSSVEISDNVVQDAAVFAQTSTLDPQYLGRHGIDVEHAQDVVVSDNEVHAAVGQPVVMRHCTQCRIEGTSN